MNQDVKVAASIISANMLNLSQEIRKLEEACVDMLHIDVYPLINFAFHYNELSKITIGPLLLDFLRRRTTLPLDVHLSIEPTKEMIETYLELGADIISFHPEIVANPEELMDIVKEGGAKLGLAVTVSSDLHRVKKLLSNTDMILMVTVNVNFSGNVRLFEAEEKIREARTLISREIDIAVDGGVNLDSTPRLIQSGATILVTGKYLFGSQDYREAVKKLKLIGREALRGQKYF